MHLSDPCIWATHVTAAGLRLPLHAALPAFGLAAEARPDGGQGGPLPQALPLPLVIRPPAAAARRGSRPTTAAADAARGAHAQPQATQSAHQKPLPATCIIAALVRLPCPIQCTAPRPYWLCTHHAAMHCCMPTEHTRRSHAQSFHEGMASHPCAEKLPGGVLLPCEPFRPLAIIPITLPAREAPEPP